MAETLRNRMLQGSQAVSAPTVAPTFRQFLATKMLGNSRAESLRGDVVRKLLGSTGLGEPEFGAVDLVPGLGTIMQAQEAGRSIATPKHRLEGAGNAALAIIPIPAVAKGAKGLVKETAKTAGEAAAAALKRIAPDLLDDAAPIIAFHGSPHKFDKFDISKMGSGEGAQAFGHGVYLAENEKVARQYRDTLSLPSSPQNDAARYWLDQANGDRTAAAKMAGDFGRSIKLPKEEIANLTDTIIDAGHMYQVGVRAQPEHFLDWDASIVNQSPKVRSALADLLGEKALRDIPDAGTYNANSLGVPFDPRSGESVFRALGPKAEASRKLKEAGIPGIRYLDQGSRSASTGTRNYVVFDPGIIDVMKRYGIAAPIAAGGIAAAQQPSSSAQPTSKPRPEI